MTASRLSLVLVLASVAVVGMLLSASIAGCAAADMTAAQCLEFCASQGKTVRSYRVGSAVPIFRPKPPVSCECDADPSPQ